MSETRHSRLGLLLLIVAAGILYLLGNGRVALWDRDEPRYAMASRYMLQTDDWVVPRIGWGASPQTARTAKPPLVYWCQAMAMKIFGPTVFAARFPSSVAMILTLAVLGCGLGKFFPQHAFWTLLIFATSVLTIITAKMCVIDSVQLLWIVICQLCVYVIWRGRSHFLIILIFGLALGLATLAKGPVAWGVLATKMLVLWLLGLSLKPRPFRHSIPILKYLIVALIALAVFVPWLILVDHRAPGFLSRIVGHDLIQRMHEPLEGHKGPPGFYLLTIFATFYPWSLFLPIAIGSAWRNRAEPHIRYALAAVIGPWLMFECISTKMVHYVLPIFPPLAFLVADAFIRELIPSAATPQIAATLQVAPAQLVESRLLPKWAISIWAILTTAIATALLLPDRWFPQTPLWPGIIVTFVGTAYAITVLALFWKNKIRRGLLAIGIGFGIFVCLLFAFYLPTASFLRISPQLADILNANDAADARMFGYEEQSLAFYDNGRIDSLPGETLHKPLSAWPAYLVITLDAYNHLPPQIKTHYQLLGAARGINYSKSIKPLDVLVARKIR